MPELMVDFMSKANPLLSTMLFGSVDIDTSTNMIYAIGGIIFILAAHYAAKHAKLEKSGDSMYYKIVEEFITWLVVFIGMTVCGILFSGMWDTTPMLLAGVTIGTLLTFIVSKIIIILFI
jgi:hypothetical protein